MANRSSSGTASLLGSREIWVVRGPNGSGKTTLLRRFLETGVVAVDEQLPDSTPEESHGKPRKEEPTPAKSEQGRGRGKDWAHAHASEVSAYVDPLPVSRDLTIQEHAHMVAASWLGNTQSAAETADQALDTFRIAHLKNRLPHQASLGQSQLFSLALAFVRPASVIVLDEPERHLDAEHTALLATIIKDRAHHGSAFLIAAHDAAISALANNLIEL